jgi:hypothetical protein
VQRHAVDRRVDVAGGEQGGQRRGEPDPAGDLGDVERLDAQPVAGEHETSGPALVQREREHPVEVVDAPCTPPVVGLEDHLRVRVRTEPVTDRLELRPQLPVVVDAPVEDDGEPELVVQHGLCPGLRQIDDLESVMEQRERALLPGARAVRATHLQAARHPRHRLGIRR